MSWEDRLKEAAYTTPEGERLTFQYENVSRSRGRKTAAFEFPDADGTFVQDLGLSGRKYPIKAIFWGADCDVEATAFEDALAVRGVGRLEHPLYGVADVVPFGDITRRDDLKTAANQSIVSITFLETTGLAYPSAEGDPVSEVIAAVEAYNSTAANTFLENAELGSEVEQASFKSRYLTLLDTVETTLAPVAAAQKDVEAQFSAVYDSIDLGIDTLVSDPLTLAFQTMILIQSPARAASAIWDRLSAYGSLLSGIVSGGTSGSTQDFRTSDLYASAYVSADVVASINTEFLTKTEALVVAEHILNQFVELATWRDANLTELEIIDTGEAYQQLQSAVAIAAGFLVEISFTLKRERRIIIGSPRTIIDLSAEIYGNVDEKLDFLINSNGLTGSEILELPRGREIVYYV